MQVTGWTDWGNKEWVDIYSEAMMLRVEATKDIKFPTREDIDGLSEDEMQKIFNKHHESMAVALDKPEIHEINKICDDCYKAVVECIRENGYHFNGNDHQNAPWGCPIIDNKYIVCLSMRSWGGIMAEAYPDEIDNSDGYGYVKWAWSDYGDVKYPTEY